MPFCNGHRAYWTWRAWVIVPGFAAVVALVILAVVLTTPDMPGRKHEPHRLFGLAACWMLVFLPTFLVLHLSAMRPTGHSRESLALSGASAEFAAAVNAELRWTGPDGAREINIAKPARPPAQKATWTTTIVFCSALILCGTVCLWRVSTLLALLVVFVFPVAAWIAWLLLVREGVLTWRRLAGKPAKLFARGDPAAAEIAFQRAVLRARRFGASDWRRGCVLVLLADYLRCQGRPIEADELYVEATAILAPHARKRQMDYFVALNNRAVLHIDLNNWSVAQSLLEKLLDLALVAKKQAAQNPGAIAPVHTGYMDFVVHFNLARIHLDLEQHAEAAEYLTSAENLLGTFRKKDRNAVSDGVLCMRGECELAQGRDEACWRILEKALNPQFPSCVRLGATLRLRAKEWVACEKALDQLQAIQKGSLAKRHPSHANILLDLAECAYNLGDREKGFALLGEARGLASEVRLRPTTAWRTALAPWIERATQGAKADLARALATEAEPDPAEASNIIVFDKLRRRFESDEP